MKYYELIATFDGESEVIFGSFDRSEVVEEKEAEQVTLKQQGYKDLKIVSREAEEKPDTEVYGETITKEDLYFHYAPSFNFELDEDQLLDVALDRGFVSVMDGQDNLFIINKDYQPISNRRK
jgi:hypothetical protein